MASFTLTRLTASHVALGSQTTTFRFDEHPVVAALLANTTSAVVSDVRIRGSVVHSSGIVMAVYAAPSNSTVPTDVNAALVARGVHQFVSDLQHRTIIDAAVDISGVQCDLRSRARVDYPLVVRFTTNAGNATAHIAELCIEFSLTCVGVGSGLPLIGGDAAYPQHVDDVGDE